MKQETKKKKKKTTYIVSTHFDNRAFVSILAHGVRLKNG